MRQVERATRPRRRGLAWQTPCYLAALVLTSACDGTLTSADDPIGGSANALWQCQGSGEDIARCSAAIPQAPGEAGAYACSASEQGPACPSVPAVSDLQTFVPEQLWDAFEKLPWACLLTGAHERECTRSLKQALGGAGIAGNTGLPALPAKPGDKPATPGQSPQPSQGGDDVVPPGKVNQPQSLSGSGAPLPADCKPKSWEPYFCAHAAGSYRKHGIDIEFPCDIFDTTADFTTLAIGSAGLPSTPGAPSCHPGESAMRSGAWLDAVSKGCTNLNDAILVMCQQGANHAPKTKKCSATGTW